MYGLILVCNRGSSCDVHTRWVPRHDTPKISVPRTVSAVRVWSLISVRAASHNT